MIGLVTVTLPGVMNSKGCSRVQAPTFNRIKLTELGPLKLRLSLATREQSVALSIVKCKTLVKRDNLSLAREVTTDVILA